MSKIDHFRWNKVAKRLKLRLSIGKFRSGLIFKRNPSFFIGPNKSFEFNQFKKGCVWRSALTSLLKIGNDFIETLIFVICVFDTLLVRIVSPERFSDVNFVSHQWVIILSHHPSVPVYFFLGVVQSDFDLDWARGKGRHKKGGDNLIYKPPLLCTYLQRSKNQRRRKAQKFKRTKKIFEKFLRIWEPFNGSPSKEWFHTNRKSLFWSKKYDFLA